MKIDPESDILGLVDIQPTFMPGGELPVADGHDVVPIANHLLTRFRHAFATQDWHPPDHASFASAHPGHAPYDVIDMSYGKQVLWPDHALAGSANAALHAALDQTRIEVVIRKGFHANLDSYSTFFENDRRTPTGLDGWLRQRGFQRLFLAGLATDFCVAWSAEDAIGLGYDVFVIEDACRGIG
ncbi:MAG: bifunctional nicotinamidase/pyrazinamidase, partial [Acetobacteraceae bacterium]